MKKLITLVLYLYCSTAVVSQTTVEDDYFSKPNVISKERVSTSVIAGGGLSFSSASQNTFYTTFIAPQIGYQLTARFKLNIGLMHYTASGNSFSALNSNDSFLKTGANAISGNRIFVGGSYQLNPKLIVSGAVLVDADNLNTKRNNFKIVTMGFDYKVSERAIIGFRASVSQGNSDYYINSRTENYQYNPNNINTMGDFFSPITQWGMENYFNPEIR